MQENLGCVYFFRHLGLKPVKIGYTLDPTPQKRFKDFKTYAPFGAEMLGYVNSSNPFDLEQRLHEKYYRVKLTGEWFDISLKDVENDIKDYSTNESLIARSFFWEKYAEQQKQLIQNNLSGHKDDLSLFLSRFIKGDTSIERKNLRELFNEDRLNKLTPQVFNKSVRKYCNMNNILLQEGKYNGIMRFYFTLVKPHTL